LACDYAERDELSVYAELMANAPGLPSPTKVERHVEAIRHVSDLVLAEQAAARHGVALSQLQVNLQNWRAIHPSVRTALHSVIADLTVDGLGIHRVAKVLKKSNRTIQLSAGRAKGLAQRGRQLNAHDGLQV